MTRAGVWVPAISSRQARWSRANRSGSISMVWSRRLLTYPSGARWGNQPLASLLSVPRRTAFFEIQNVLIGHAGLHGEDQHIVRRQIGLLRGLDNLKNAALQEPGKAARIDGVAGEAVDAPAENAIGLPLFDEFEHSVESNAGAGILGGTALLNLFDYIEAALLGEGAENAALVFNGLDLAVFTLARFPGVEDVSHLRFQSGR